MPQQSLEISASQYATRRKELLALLKELRATGSQGDLDLPRITVIGNQSAGKSSVVEAISGINVPRDAGTCTRCPMECRLSSSSGKWTCQISIRQEFSKSGKVLDKVSETLFGPPITEKSKVEIALRRAQVAVLNPHLTFKTILSQSAQKLTKAPFVSSDSLSFSRNTICVDLEGPDLTDLAFVDLPGLIQNADPSIVKLVEDMVVSHIRGNCLILVTLPMIDDIENQKAVQLARQEDPDGHRTIGVMTKPDMLTLGSTKARDLWLDVIEGRRHPLVHGYYCTRHPDDAQRAANISPGEAREAETQYFAGTTPWSISVHKNRFGTNHLISTLSSLLIGIINSTLPRIRSEAISKLEHCTGELTRLPKEMDIEPATYMLRLLTNFSDMVQKHVMGGIDENRMIHENRDAYAALKAAIRRTAPNFIPTLRDAASSEKDGGSIGVQGVDSRTRSEPCYLDGIREHVRQELPNNVPFRAKEILITRFQTEWEEAVQDCFRAVSKSVETMLEECINKNFYRYEKLVGHIRVFVSEIVRKHHDICLELLRPVLLVELVPYTQNTHYLVESSDKWFAKYKDARRGDGGRPPRKKQKVSAEVGKLAPGKPANASKFGGTSGGKATATLPPLLGDSIWIQDDGDDFESNVSETLASLATLGYTGITLEDLGKLNQADEYETELRVMAEVRGYFQIAYKRIIDNIPSLIDLTFVKPIGDDLLASLITKLALGTQDAKERCGAYLLESPSVVIKRKELKARKRRLEGVKLALHNFGLT